MTNKNEETVTTKNRHVDDVRDFALEILYNVFEKGAYANLALDKGLRNAPFSLSNKRLVTQLVNGTVRMSKHLEWVLNLFLKRPLERQNPWIRNILRLALYQCLFMDKIPAYASINTAAEQTKIRVGFRLTGMVNGVLRNIVRNRENITYPSREKEPVAYLAVYYSHPEWIVEQWINAYGLDQTINILEYNNEPARINLRCNQLKASRSQLIEKLAEDGIKAVPAEYPWAAEVESTESPIIDSSAFKQGWFYIQGSASMLAAPILKPLPGQIVYDLCCGVGGKTTHLAENMENRGVIKAIDLYEHKINLLRENSGRLGIKIIDASVRDLRTVDTVNWDRAPRVLLDAPCSGLGVFNRRADARWHKKVEEIKELTLLQKELLDKAANLVERNGLLLYSTCTINRAENEEIISDFLMRHRDFGLQGFAQDIGFLPLTAAEVQQATQGMFTLLPGNHGTDGMFYALMRRN